MNVHPLGSEAELERALEVTAAAWREAFDHVVSDDDLARVERELLRDVSGRYRTLRGDPAWTALVATDADVVGWASATRGPDRTRPYVGDREAELRTLYVRPDRWGEGVGTALLDAVLDRLPDGVERVVLETFRENDQGRSFYESRGFAVRSGAEFDVAGTAYPSVVLARDL